MARSSPFAASSVKRWSISARPRSISAIIRCEARSCSATRLDRPSSDVFARSMLAASAFGGLDAGLADAGRRLLDQRGDRRGLGVDARADLVERRRGAVEQRVERARESASAPRRRARPRPTPAVSISASRAASRSVASAIDLVGLARALGERCDLLAELRGLRRPIRCRSARSCSATARAVASARGRSSSSTAMSLRAASAARSSASPWRFSRSLLDVELARDPAELAGRLVAELHQMLRDHRQLGPAVADPLRQDFEQRLERPRFGAHRDDRAGEALGFLAPGAAEHQPDEAEQRQRPGGERDPLRDRGRGQRLAGERPAGRPGADSRATAPQGRLSALPSTCRPPAPRSSRLAARPIVPGRTPARRLRRCSLVRSSGSASRPYGGGTGSARFAMGSWQWQFTIFDEARKRLERGSRG